MIGDSPINLDFSDDGEYSAGRRIVEGLTQNKEESCAIYIVRYHSGQNLGVHRFELMLEMAAELCELIKKPENVITSRVKPHSEQIHLKDGIRRSHG